MLLINWIACALAELWRPFVWHQHRLTARSELICSISSFIFSALSLSLVISVQSLCAHCVFVHLLFVVANYRDDLYSSFRYCTCCNKPNYSCHFVYCSQAALFAYITQSHSQEWGKKMLSVLGIVIRIALDWDFNWVFFVLPNNDEARKQLFSSLIYCCLAVENWAQHSSEALFWASPRKCSTKLLGTIRCHFGPPHDRVQRAGVTSFDLLFFAVVDAAAFAASVFCRLLCFFSLPNRRNAIDRRVIVLLSRTRFFVARLFQWQNWHCIDLPSCVCLLATLPFTISCHAPHLFMLLLFFSLKIWQFLY